MPTDQWTMPDKLLSNIMQRVGDVCAHSKVPGSFAVAAVEAATPGVVRDVQAEYSRVMNRIMCAHTP